jgi:hypothetical protein
MADSFAGAGPADAAADDEIVSLNHTGNRHHSFGDGAPTSKLLRPHVFAMPDIVIALSNPLSPDCSCHE